MSVMTRDDVIRKIKKLLRLKHGGTPDEIATALDLARNLAEQHGIELDSVNADLDGDRYTVKHSEVRSYTRVPQELHFAGNLVKEYFDVDWIITYRAEGWRVIRILNVIGNDIERLFASHLLIYIAREMNRAWRHRRGRARNRTAFLHGFAIGISEAVARLRPPRPKSQALAVSFGAYLDRVFPSHRGGKKLDTGAAAAAKYAGYQAGKDTVVNKVVDGTDAPALAPARRALPA